MSEYKIPLEKIESFLQGHDDEKYIVNIEFDEEKNTIYKIIDNPETGKKSIETEQLKAFCWIKNLNEIKQKVNRQVNGTWVRGFWGGDAGIAAAMQRYGIKIKPLRHDNNLRLVNGYRYLVTCEQGYKQLFNFFRDGGINPYDKRYNTIDHFMFLKPIEQYLVGTGKRLFKGFTDYNQIHKAMFDIETTGLDPERCRIDLIGIKDNRGFEELLDAGSDEQGEIKAILSMFAIIDYLKPSIIGGHNSANFDWSFIWRRCEILGIDITKYAKTLNPNIPINRTKGTLKLGGEVEDYQQVNIWGMSVIDTIHAARRAQAIDSDMKSASLKYIIKYNKIAKKNRVYVVGNKIGEILRDTDTYYFDERTGKYSKNKPRIEYWEHITRKDIMQNRDKVFVFGDNDERVGYGGQAKEMRGPSNSIGVRTKAKASHDWDAYYYDTTYDANVKKIKEDIARIMEAIQDGKTVVIPTAGLGTGLAKLAENAPKTLAFINGMLKQLEAYCDSFKEVTGAYIVKRYLMDDLWETQEVDNIYNQTGFMLASMVPTTYQRILTMGTAGLWKMLMQTWSYENDLALPTPDTKRDFVGGLSRLLKSGFSKELRKADFNSLYPAIQLAHNVFPSVDISGAMKSMLKYFHRERFAANDLSKKYKKEGNEQLSSFYKRKQLPLKIFINSMFGALGAPQAFPWAEINVSERVTCTARQYLRLMVRFFMNRGYVAAVLDTDGVNFIAPANEDSFVYTSNGNHKKETAGKTYKGFEAVVMEFNDLYMKGEMGLGVDGSWPSTLNFARKNYALLEDGKVKKTGNSIKSKKIATFIEEFLDKALRLLLEGKGAEFVEYYYEYVDKILNKEIPLSKIATKGKVKKTINQYVNRGTNVKGDPLPKQAHMELAIKANLDVHLGDVLYYINVGKKKGDTDVGTHIVVETNPETGEEIKIEKPNCILLSDKEIEENPYKLGEYNVPRYLEVFNKKVKPLMICFDHLVRDRIQIMQDPASAKKKKPKKLTKKETREYLSSLGWVEKIKERRWNNFQGPEYLDLVDLTMEEAFEYEKKKADDAFAQAEFERTKGRVVFEKPEFLPLELELVNGQPFKPEDQDTLEELFTPSLGEQDHWDPEGYNPMIWKDKTAKFTVPGLGFEREIL